MFSDGTLITQRFHFVSSEHASYHVLGWYRLARELNRHNISAICVFDGKERNIAKANEVSKENPQFIALVSDWP
jgi:flap endonuclease-1